MNKNCRVFFLIEKNCSNKKSIFFFILLTGLKKFDNKFITRFWFKLIPKFFFPSNRSSHLKSIFSFISEWVWNFGSSFQKRFFKGFSCILLLKFDSLMKNTFPQNFLLQTSKKAFHISPQISAKSILKGKPPRIKPLLHCRKWRYQYS